MARALIQDAADPVGRSDAWRRCHGEREFYRLIRVAVDTGKLVIWHRSETSEFLECDLVLLFHEYAARRVLAGAELTEDAIVNATFTERIADRAGRSVDARHAGAAHEALFRTLPFLTRR